MKVPVLCCAVLLAGCAKAPLINDETPVPENIVVIIADDLGWSDLGSFGSEMATPELDALAYNGLRLVDFHTTSKCFPSRAALMTGLYPQQVNRSRKARSPMIGGVTIAESLRDAGWQTLMVGKHHGITHPMDRGFDRYIGLRDGAANQFNPGTEARPGEPEPARKAKDGRWWCFDLQCQQGYDAPADYYSTDTFTDWALELLNEADTDTPIFLYLSYTAPHDPLHVPEEDWKAYEGRYSAGYASIAEARYRRLIDLGLLDPDAPRREPLHRDWSTLSDAERADQQARMEIYAGMVTRMDRQIGRVVDWLDARDELDNTLFIFTSDNGASSEMVYEGGVEIGSEHPVGSVGRWASLGGDWAEVANTPFRYFKNYSFNGGTAAPTIIHWPDGNLAEGGIVKTTSSLMDIHPTVLALTGVTYDPSLGPDGAAEGLAGIDLSDTLLNGAEPARPAPIFNRWQGDRMVRDGRWKLVSHSSDKVAENGTWQLFDLETDPAETTDVSEDYPDIAQRLAVQYQDWRAGPGAEGPGVERSGTQ